MGKIANGFHTFIRQKCDKALKNAHKKADRHHQCPPSIGILEAQRIQMARTKCCTGCFLPTRFMVGKKKVSNEQLLLKNRPPGRIQMTCNPPPLAIIRNMKSRILESSICVANSQSTLKSSKDGTNLMKTSTVKLFYGAVTTRYSAPNIDDEAEQLEHERIRQVVVETKNHSIILRKPILQCY